MQLEILKPKIKLIEGIPANRYGEWPGQFPNKFSPSKCIVRPKPSYNIIVSDLEGIS